MPRKPDASSIDCHTSKISKFVDHYLEPRANAFSSYVQDTRDVNNKLEIFNGESKKLHPSHIECKSILHKHSKPRVYRSYERNV